MVLEKTLESPLESKESKPVNLKGNQPWIHFGRTDAEAEAPILGLCDSLEKTMMRKKMKVGEEDIEDEVVGWHHQFSGHELGQTLGDGQGQGSLACCCPWGCKELDRT